MTAIRQAAQALKPPGTSLVASAVTDSWVRFDLVDLEGGEKMKSDSCIEVSRVDGSARWVLVGPMADVEARER